MRKLIATSAIIAAMTTSVFANELDLAIDCEHAAYTIRAGVAMDGVRLNPLTEQHTTVGRVCYDPSTNELLEHDIFILQVPTDVGYVTLPGSMRSTAEVLQMIDVLRSGGYSIESPTS